MMRIALARTVLLSAPCMAPLAAAEIPYAGSRNRLAPPVAANERDELIALVDHASIGRDMLARVQTSRPHTQSPQRPGHSRRGMGG